MKMPVQVKKRISMIYHRFTDSTLMQDHISVFLCLNASIAVDQCVCLQGVRWKTSKEKDQKRSRLCDCMSVHVCVPDLLFSDSKKSSDKSSGID